MGKGRAPCCDKNQVKRGPWSPAEDLRLITFIQKHGHENWRALPKQAGLLRCGKSCRLRWINYLRPDVKRGNFTIEEEDIIIKLHQTLGNKWSKIASFLPGRTDNEIKNVWNTHLKKRVVGLTKDDRESISNKECSSPTSSSSSNSTNNIVSSGEKRSMDHHQTQLLDINHHHDQLEEADDHDQCVTTKKARPNMEELLLPSDHLIDNSNLEEVNKSRPDDRDHHHHHHHQDQVQGNDHQEIPLEVDYDFWDMLDGINYLQSIHGSNITLHPEIENRMWVRFLETELGLDHHQAITTTKADDDHDLAANKGTDKAAVDPAGVGNNQFSP